MKLLTTHPWQSPLTFADQYDGQDIALLYSGLAERDRGVTSYLFVEPLEHCRTSEWSTLPTIDNASPLPQWVGYLGYGMRHGLEKYRRGAASIIDLPDCWLTRYGRLFRFDHTKEVIEEFGSEAGLLAPAPKLRRTERPEAGLAMALHSNFTRASYEAAVRATLERIRAGDFYQANLTRKFYGDFKETPSALHLFTKLCAISPAPYSAFIRHGDTAIVSSSPECFLSIDVGGTITSRPIKGSAKRDVDPANDRAIARALTHSAKNSAENLMIVDLMRHDLARVSKTGSVRVEEQSKLYSYATIHHLVSTITAQKREDTGAYDVLCACFPPGSMTGAPKIAAVEWCTLQEKLERGVYSGAIGWFGGQDTCDLSVVIRTLIVQGNRFEFQVGGGIVADSNPEEEWQETLVKARGIGTALGINEAQLAAL